MGAKGIERPTVLVVENDANDVLLLRRAIKKTGIPCEFRFVHDGEQALAYLSGAAPFDDRVANPFPDLMLLDLNLPKVDGFAVLEWLQQARGCEALKIVVWSGLGNPGVEERARTLGASAFICKQGRLEMFSEALDTLAAVLNSKPLPRSNVPILSP